LNTGGYQAVSWILQQDYLTFLAVLGWLTAGLIAWGEAAAETDSRALPLKWFAFFCFFTSLDATFDLAKMIAPQVWPREIDAALRLASYGYLLEFSRRAARRWLTLPGWLPAALASGAQLILFFAPKTAPVPEFAVALLAGISGAVVIVASTDKGTRALLAVAGMLPFLGPGELLRRGGGVAIEGLYGLLVTGEGIAAAVNAAVLAWVAAAGLWLHGIVRQRTGLFAGRPEAFSPVTAIVLPAVLALTLIAGFFLVNRSAQRARESIEREYVNRTITAALAVDPEALAASQGGGSAEAAESAFQRVRREIRAVQSVSDDIEHAYLWNVVGGRILLPGALLAGQKSARDEAAIVRVGVQALASSGRAHVLGPVGNRENAVMIANAPVLDPSTHAHLAWLGIDFSANDWLISQAVARLQTIALVGLFASLVVFFLAHVLLREYEAELLIGKERAEAADRAKDEFLAVMSHEIRTPMHSVLGYSELLARTALTGAQSSYLETIRNQGRTLLRIVQDILDFSALRKSSYTLKSETFYLPRVVETAFDSIRPLAARKKLRFEYTLAPSLPETVRGDAVRLEQILLNLLNNSVKFTDQGGVQLDVTLEKTGPATGGEIHHVLFCISDTGIGIRPEQARRLFQPFTRILNDDQIEREGTGLGLAIVKRLCELMGGTIELQSEWGEGSRFFVRLPLAHSTAAPASVRPGPATPIPATPAAPTVNLGAVLPLRILVADDNPFVRRLLVEYLRSTGYEPETTTSGAEAVERWRDFDLLMMDLRMPGLDGISAAEKIRAASGSDTWPWMIGVSATLAENEIERAMKAGMNDFLGKPFFVQSLVEAIQASPLYARRTADPATADDADETAGEQRDRPAGDGGNSRRAGGNPVRIGRR
jgi:signal transduction histidine kinase/CheY-like chemotaxis protein